jgi:hypothetical protein
MIVPFIEKQRTAGFMNLAGKKVRSAIFNILVEGRPNEMSSE